MEEEEEEDTPMLMKEICEKLTAAQYVYNNVNATQMTPMTHKKMSKDQQSSTECSPFLTKKVQHYSEISSLISGDPGSWEIDV